MAYTLVAAQVRSRIDPSSYDIIDVAMMQINDLLSQYSDVYLTLFHQPTNHNVFVSLDEIRDFIRPSTESRTLSEWLVENGNRTLPTRPSLPSTTPKRMYCNEIFRAGYDAKPADISRSPNSNVPESEKHDLLISKSDVDFTQWWRYCLVTINGMFHRVIGSQDGLYVLDGNRSANIANQNFASLFSFREMGPIRTIPITPSMVYKTNDQQKYRNYAYIRLPESIENKTVFMVIGGYLHPMDEIYKVFNDHALRVDFNNMLFPERIYDSKNRINLESLQLEPSDKNDQQYGLEDIYDDSTILAYLTLPQSFIIIIDSPSVYVKRHYLERTDLPGRFLTYKPMPRYPMFSTLGRCFDYSWFPKDDRVVLSTEHNHRFKYNFTTVPWKPIQSLDSTHYSFRPWEFSDAYMLEIGRF